MEKSHEYKMGYDCAINGSNENNCHFSIFSTPEKTKQWEQGNKDGQTKKQKRLDNVWEDLGNTLKGMSNDDPGF